MNLQKLWDYAPFLMTTNAALPEGRKMNWAKVWETLVIAAATALAINYTTTQVLGAKIDDLQVQMQQVEHRLDTMQQDFYFGPNNHRQGAH